jgi:hypothetical protein
VPLARSSDRGRARTCTLRVRRLMLSPLSDATKLGKFLVEGAKGCGSDGVIGTMYPVPNGARNMTRLFLTLSLFAVLNTAALAQPRPEAPPTNAPKPTPKMPFPPGARAVQWEYACPNGDGSECSIKCGAEKRSVVSFQLVLGSISIVNQEIPAYFYGGTTNDGGPSSFSGFSQERDFSCEVSGMRLSYSGPPRAEEAPPRQAPRR